MTPPWCLIFTWRVKKCVWGACEGVKIRLTRSQRHKVCISSTVPKGTPFNRVNLKEKKRFFKKIPKERLAVFFVEIKVRIILVLFCHKWKWKGSKYFCKQFQRGSLSLDLWCDFEEIDFKKIEFRQLCKFEFLATMLNDVKSKGISNESFFYCNFAHHKETKWWKFNSFICRFFKNHCWKTWNLLSF